MFSATTTARRAGSCKKHKKTEAICCSTSTCRARPNRGELEQRLRKRSQDAESVIQRRLEAAAREIENYGKYDYILVNDRLEDSVDALKAILLSERQKREGQPDAELLAIAERCRLERIRQRLQPILQSFQETAAGGGK
jgi:hypothetical protein